MAVTEANILTRNDTAANWASANPVLKKGEVGIENDTDKEKKGNGVDAWNDLDYSPDLTTIEANISTNTSDITDLQNNKQDKFTNVTKTVVNDGDSVTPQNRFILDSSGGVFNLNLSTGHSAGDIWKFIGVDVSVNDVSITNTAGDIVVNIGSSIVTDTVFIVDQNLIEVTIESIDGTDVRVF